MMFLFKWASETGQLIEHIYLFDDASKTYFAHVKDTTTVIQIAKTENTESLYKVHLAIN